MRAIWEMVRDAGTAWVDDYASSMGAALSYYTLFSLAPLLLIVISVAGMVFGTDAARGEIFAQLRDLLGDEGATAIEGLLKSVDLSNKGALGTVIGVVLLLIGATSVFGELQDALDRIWRTPQQARSAWWTLLRARLLSFGLILALGFLLMVSLVASAAMAAWNRWWTPLFSGWQVLAECANVALSFVLTTGMFAFIYKYLPRVRIAGAEFTWVYAHRYGSRRAARETPGEPLAPRAPPTLEPTGSNAPVTAPRAS